MNRLPSIVTETNVRTLLKNAKWAYTTRRVPPKCPCGISRQLDPSNAGDLVLARVLKTGSHRRIQTRDMYHSDLYPDDLIVATLGARFATDQFEGTAECPETRPADLLAGGGIVGSMRVKNAGVKAPTSLHVLGRLTDECGQVLNVSDFAIAPKSTEYPDIILGVIGTAMNAGKTSAASWLIHGLERAGMRAAGIKLTGTGSFGDPASYRDASATAVLDFTDAGLASTYMAPFAEITHAFDQLLKEAHQRGCNIAVVELADSVAQVETGRLLDDQDQVAMFDGFVLAAGDAMAASGALAWLSARNIIPHAISGTICKAPLAVKDLAAQSSVPVFNRETLGDPATISALLTGFQRNRAKQQA